MEDILTLIKISKGKGQRSIQLVNQNFRKKEISKDNLLYEGVLQGRYTTDHEAASDMFRTNPGNRNYRNAKGKLKQKLLNHLYFLDYEKSCYSAYDKINYECLHTLHQCKILINEGAGETAVKLLPQLIKVSTNFEFVDIAVEALTLLRNEYAKDGKTTPYEETQKKLSRQRALQAVVFDCEKIYYDILAQVNKSVSAQQRIMKSIPHQEAKIKAASKKMKSRRLHVLSLKLQLLYNVLVGDFKANVKLCDIIEKEYLERGQGPNPATVDIDQQEIAFHKLYAYYCLKDAVKGEAYAEKKLKLFKKGSPEWHRFIEYYFLLMTKNQQYKKAGDIFRKVRTEKNYHLLDQVDKDRWQVYRAYLIFVKDSKLLRWGFDLKGFMHTTPSFPKNLTGYNVAINVIQYLYFLREGNVEKVRESVKNLQQYNSTHLDKRNNYRNSLFIRLLSMVPEKDFGYTQTRDKANTYYNKLKKVQIPGDLSGDMEIIPYETLWKMVLNILKNNKVYTHYRFYHAPAKK